jgi:hypothetical protein
MGKLFANFNAYDMSQARLFDHWASQVMEKLPENTVFLVTESLTAYTLLYAQVLAQSCSLLLSL